MDKKELFGVLDAFNMLNKLNVPDAESVVEQEEEPVNLDKEAFKQFFEETLRRLIIDEHEAINGYESFKLSLLAEKERRADSRFAQQRYSRRGRDSGAFASEEYSFGNPT